jgi:hypothetical protein
VLHRARGAFHKDCGGLVTFGLGEFCTACEDENPGWEERPLVPRALPACWTARCDGECEGDLEDDEGGFVHFPGRSAAEDGASRWYEWRFLADGRSFCEDDAPPGAYLLGEQADGQLALPVVQP